MVSFAAGRPCHYLAAAPFVAFALSSRSVDVMTSTQDQAELYDLGQTVPGATGVTWEHYRFLFERTGFPLWFRNSELVAVATPGSVLSHPRRLRIARLRFGARRWVSTLVFVVYLVPTTLLFIPLAGSPGAGAVEQPLGADRDLSRVRVPFATWMLTAYFSTIPREWRQRPGRRLLPGAGFAHVILRWPVRASYRVAVRPSTLAWASSSTRSRSSPRPT